MMKNKEHPVCVNFMFSFICLNNIYRNIGYCLFNRYHLCFELITRHTGKYDQPAFQAWKSLAVFFYVWDVVPPPVLGSSSSYFRF